VKNKILDGGTIYQIYYVYSHIDLLQILYGGKIYLMWVKNKNV